MNLEERLVKMLLDRNEKVSTAESCTGGLVAGKIVNVSGASEVFDEGYVTYANKSKAKLLGVSKEILDNEGAVSKECAIEMAIGCAKAANAQLGLSTTGIAGPGGGTEEKPVGLVYIGCSVNGKTTAKRCVFDGNRMENRQHTVETALEMLVEALENLEK